MYEFPTPTLGNGANQRGLTPHCKLGTTVEQIAHRFPYLSLHHRAVQLGAMGLVLKKKEPEVLFKAIEKIHQGEAWLDRCTIATVLARLSRPERDEDSAEAAKIKTLTKKDDRSVVSLLFL